jgi:hypothetical protein
VDAWTLSVLVALAGATAVVLVTGVLVARGDRPTSRRRRAV